MPLPSSLQCFCWKICRWPNRVSIVCNCFLLLLLQWSLSLLLVILITVCFGVALLELILWGALYASWIWIRFLPQIWEVSSCYLSKFSDPYSLSCPSRSREMWMLLCLMESLNSLSLVLLCFFLSLAQLDCFPLQSSRMRICSSDSSNLFIPSSGVLSSFTEFFISGSFFMFSVC